MGPKKKSGDKSPTKIGIKTPLGESDAQDTGMSEPFNYDESILNGKVSFNAAELFMDMIMD